MAEPKVIGIIGGMGPLATADLFRKIVENTDVKTDQEHPRICVDSNTAVPNRTDALLHGGPSPVPEILKSAKRLVSIGAELLAIPCNTSHCFFDEIQAGAGVPVLHMIELTRDALGGVKRAGLLATDGTVETGIYQRVFAGGGPELLLPPPEDQRAVMGIIYDGVKAGRRDYDATAFRRCCENLLSAGAETLILGCTELPLAFAMYNLDYPMADPTLELARGAIRAAGCPVRNEKERGPI